MSKKPQNFSTMDKKKQALVARKGGREAHAQGVAHEFTSAEGRAAGLKRWNNQKEKK